MHGLLLGVCCLLLGASCVAGFERGWRFSRDGGPCETVDIPHDGAIGHAFDLSKWDSGTGALPCSGHGEYVKAFDLDPAGRSWRLEFDGVMSHAKVFVNGTLAAERPFGYASFVVPLDGLVRKGGNEVRVTVDPPEGTSRWYPGFGIYRPVRLVVAARDHLVPGSLVVAVSNVCSRSADVTFGWTMSESGPSSRSFRLDRPRLWSPETPNLYTAEVAGVTFRYGVRTLRFDPSEGFFLNGRHRQMRGVCLHHDLGVFGAAFVPEAARRQLARLKEMGCDALRTSHNPPAPQLLDLCDEMGLMVMAEAFDEWSTPKVKHGIAEVWARWHRAEVESLVRMGRNHPSVVMWSVGNEVPEGGDPALNALGVRTARELTALVHANDPESRPVTAGHWADCAATNGVGAATDVFGANYLPHRYPEFRGRQGVVGTETCSTVSSRGVYGESLTNRTEVAGQVSSYDLCVMWPNDYPPDVEFDAQDANPHVYGEFVWTGFDYLGEPDPWRKCARSSYFGIFDLCGFPKDRYWLYRSRWRPDVPTAHVLPHWNPLGGALDSRRTVFVYTNGDEAELFLNGRSLGRKRRGADGFRHRFVWRDVPYERGEVSVRTWKDGGAWATDTIRTSGAFARFETSDETVGPWLFRTYRAVDEQGRFVPTATEAVRFTQPAGYRFYGCCNGDPTELRSFRSSELPAFSGLALGVFRAVRQTKSDRSFVASCDGSVQRYVEIVPDAWRPEAGALIALHGHGSDRRQFAEATETKAERRVRLLRNAGCSSSRPTTAPRRRGWGRRPRQT